MELIGGQAILERVYHAAEAAKCLTRVVDYEVAVLCPDMDSEIIDFCHMAKMNYRQGDSKDLITRYMKAAIESEANAIVRLTADCWALRSSVIRECIQAILEVDYASTTMIRSFEEGQDVQAASVCALTWIDTHQKEEREHPFKVLDENALERKKFTDFGYTIRMILNPQNEIFHKTSIDTPEELEQARKWYEVNQRRL